MTNFSACFSLCNRATRSPRYSPLLRRSHFVSSLSFQVVCYFVVYLPLSSVIYRFCFFHTILIFFPVSSSPSSLYSHHLFTVKLSPLFLKSICIKFLSISFHSVSLFYRVARSRLTYFKFEYYVSAIACRGWWEGER